MRGLDFTSWQSILTTVLGLVLVSILGVGIRLVLMQTVQQRRERVNRQINERLRTLIAAYKVLGGSFTGDLDVDPSHLRQSRQAGTAGVMVDTGSDRSRRIRDAVEAALSDIVLLGTEDHVRLAEKAARELVSGRPVQTHELVVSLRDFIRQALDLDPVPVDLQLPRQGPTRPSSSGGKSGGTKEGAGGGRGGGGGMGGGGTGGGMGAGTGAASDPEDDARPAR